MDGHFWPKKPVKQTSWFAVDSAPSNSVNLRIYSHSHIQHVCAQIYESICKFVKFQIILYKNTKLPWTHFCCFDSPASTQLDDTARKWWILNVQFETNAQGTLLNQLLGKTCGFWKHFFHFHVRTCSFWVYWFCVWNILGSSFLLDISPQHGHQIHDTYKILMLMYLQYHLCSM